MSRDKNNTQQQAYYDKNKRSLLGDYLKQELEQQERIIYANDAFVVFIPLWAIWPFETMIVTKRVQKHILEMADSEAQLFAEAISVITKTYDKLFNTLFPYSSGIHHPTTNGENNKHWHWHEFYPPLLRSSTVKIYDRL